LSPFIEKAAWPIFVREPYGWDRQRGGIILYTAIVDWETHRLAQSLGQINSPDPFRPDRLSTYPARALDALWNTSESVSVDLQTQDESVALITFIVEKYGDQAVAKLLNSIGNAPSLSKVIETSLGIQYSDFEQSWYDWLKQYRAD
ncbi:MAG TPA: hypothetical protein VLG46_04190, partial [Anaerolineae bacterium]|nr:hypothetical protein [Anaerolineae bacterium]